MEKMSLRRDVQRLSASRRNSSIDFQDVFGGPPRMSSVQDMHDDDDEADEWRSSCSGQSTSEKPVFGGEHSSRRRCVNDYFFDDIFMSEKQQHLDSPGSRILSPVRPLPPKIEPFAPSPLPAQFSLPATLSKAVDLPLVGSAAHSTYKQKYWALNGTQHSSNPDISPPRFSSESINCQEEKMHDVQSYRLSPLSREISRNSEESISSDLADKENRSKKDFDSENTKSSSQFHFSIYKWAGIGVPSVIPIRTGRNSRLKKMTKIERSSSFRSWIASKGSTDNVHNPNDSGVANTIAEDNDCSRMDCGEDGNELYDGNSEHIVKSKQTDQKPDPSKSEAANTNSSSVGRDNDSPKNHISHYAGPKEGSQRLPEKVAAKKVDKEISVEAHKSGGRSLHALFSKGEYDIGSNKTSSKSEVKEDKGKSSVVNSKQKKRDEENSTQTNGQVNNSSLHGSSLKKGDDVRKVKGKVKDFVKIFNQDASSSSKVGINSGSQSNRWANDTLKKEKEEVVEATRTNDKLQVPTEKTKKMSTDKIQVPTVKTKKTFTDKFQVPTAKTKKMSTDASIKANEYLKESGNQHSARKTSKYVSNDTSTTKKDGSTSNTASIPDGSKTTGGVPEEYFSGSFQVNDLFEIEDEALKKDNNHAIDATIRKWSNGKEGNIRSLLSTLQYVLWPESGWKPVPLVDIIEGNAVKRAYQKALLRLHPDKLQQKGASSDQKYIAEKVFDILQEAWDHFNSLNSF